MYMKQNILYFANKQFISKDRCGQLTVCLSRSRKEWGLEIKGEKKQ